MKFKRSEWRRRFRVVRKYRCGTPEENRFYAFLYHDETADEDAPARLLRFEAIGADWFDEFRRRVGVTPDGATLESALADLPDEPFSELVGTLGPPVLALFDTAHRQYLAEVLHHGHPAPVALLEVTAPAELVIREGDWYEIRAGAGTRLTKSRNAEDIGEVIVARLGVTPAGDLPLTVHTRGEEAGGWLARLEKPLQPLLSGLHYPQPLRRGEGGSPPSPTLQVDPDAPGPAPHTIDPWRWWRTLPGSGGDDELAVENQSGAEDPPRELGGIDWALLRRLRLMFGRYGGNTSARGARRLNLLAPLSERLAVGIERMAALSTSVPGNDEASAFARSGGEYGGGGAGGGGGSAGGSGRGPAAMVISGGHGALDPSNAGTYLPFVGANAVGAANNIALWGDDGSVAAYVDFGHPTRTNQETCLGPHPCVCSDPVIVLTHWDYDHFAMGRYVPEAFARRWVAPQQPMGPVALREAYVRILAEAGHGGELHLWCGTGHARTGFGFLVRATGKPVNDDGLAAYVQVDGAAVPAPPGPFAPRKLPGPRPGSRAPGVPCATVHPGGLEGERIDARVLAPFDPHRLVVDPTALKVPWLPQPAGTEEQVPGGGKALWIPAEGIGVFGGDVYIPPGGAGGWAVTAEDFVRLGGILVDYPDSDTVKPNSKLMVFSPTPGSSWDPNANPKGAVRFPATGVKRTGGGRRWVPAWGTSLGDAWAMPLDRATLARLNVLAGSPAELALDQGDPLYGADDRFVLLPGDAGLHEIAIQTNPRTAPTVVALAAAHHGAHTWIRSAAAAAAIPPAPAASDTNASGAIIYSYGVRPSSLGHPNGHPSSKAVKEYESRGWGMPRPVPPPPAVFRRLDTAPEGFRSAQRYDPLSLYGNAADAAAAWSLGHYSGNVAVGWHDGAPISSDVVPPGAPVATPLAADLPARLHRTCGVCTQTRDFFF